MLSIARERTIFKDPNGVVEPFKISEKHPQAIVEVVDHLHHELFLYFNHPCEWVSPEGEVSVILVVMIVKGIVGAVISRAEETVSSRRGVFIETAYWLQEN